MKKIIAIALLVACSLGIGTIFWYVDFVYSLPTEIPEAYHAVPVGTNIDVAWKMPPNGGKPILLHFFNPDCPCSRFNIPHFKSLVKEYGSNVTFVVVPMLLPGVRYTEQEIQQKFGLDIPVLFDNSLAEESGVYSTPQAVIVNSDHTLYYRGNYNKSRYCTDKKSNYAQMALDSLLSHHDNPVFSELALRAYGCQLPNCTK